MSRLSRWSIHLHVSSNLIEKKRNQERAPPNKRKGRRFDFTLRLEKKTGQVAAAGECLPEGRADSTASPQFPCLQWIWKRRLFFSRVAARDPADRDFLPLQWPSRRDSAFFFFFLLYKITFFLSSHRRSFCVEKKENFYSGLLSKDVIARIAYRKVICFSFHVHQLGIFRRNRQEQTHSNVSLPFTELTFFPFKSSPPPPHPLKLYAVKVKGSICPCHCHNACVWRWLNLKIETVLFLAAFEYSSSEHFAPVWWMAVLSVSENRISAMYRDPCSNRWQIATNYHFFTGKIIHRHDTVRGVCKWANLLDCPCPFNCNVSVHWFLIILKLINELLAVFQI